MFSAADAVASVTSGGEFSDARSGLPASSFGKCAKVSFPLGIHRHLTIRSSRPHVVASATCYALRLHASAAPPRGGLTQALALKNMATRKPYKDRTDLEKIQSQWHKLSGLHSREEWSAAIVRAATTAELAANFAIRKEYAAKSTLSTKFVDSQLKWANGIAGKMDRLLLNLTDGDAHHLSIRALTELSGKINKVRNAIVHQGEFCNSTEAKEAIQNAKAFIEGLIQIYEPSFLLKERKR